MGWTCRSVLAVEPVTGRRSDVGLDESEQLQVAWCCPTRMLGMVTTSGAGTV